MAHMAKEPFELAWWPICAMAATLVNNRIQLVPPLPFAAFVLAVILVGYLHYVVSLVAEICTYLGIACLTIPVKED